jgi:hypothetical protein
LADHINIVKLCVGCDSVEELEIWREENRRRLGRLVDTHVTRMWPKRAAEVLNGGSLYWVFKGVILARQRIVALEEHVGGDGIARCAIVMDPELIRTEGAARRPFQGWRYLPPEDSPRDLPKARALDDSLPEALSRALAEIGLR